MAKKPEVPVVHVLSEMGGIDSFVGVIPGKSIRLYGTTRRFVNGKVENVPYDRTFEIGDAAEYDSYNLSYIGTIKSISMRCVVIAKGSSGEGTTARLKLEEFNWRNKNFVEAEVRRQNSEDMMYL